MTRFGLITEGRTDQIIIENILLGYFNSDYLEIDELQPLLDEADEAAAQHYGGWYKVFEYCQSNKFREAGRFYDYIIIQIDTDVSEEKHYDIPKYENGIELSPEQLIQRVREKFIGLIGEEFYEKYQEKIIFAISVHFLECWLLYYNDKKKSKVKSCLGTLNKALQKREGITINAKNPVDYEIISEKSCKHKILMKLYKENPSLKVFIEELQKRNIVIEADDF
jgi:hypothetical protein